MKAVVVALGLILLLSGCDDAPVTSCEDDPMVDCCDVDPTLPGCVPPTCADDPTLPMCRVSCEDDPLQDSCRVPCGDDALGPHCVPPQEGLRADVEVMRDDLGIPHVFAVSNGDAMWASGYMQATDRLFQMDLSRRRALGRQAEVRGAGSVGDDTLMRTVDIEGWSEQGLLRMRVERPELFDLLVAWTRGVNARIDEVLGGGVPMPEGFVAHDYVPERWRIVDGAAVGKLLLFGSSNQIENDILASTIRDYLPDAWRDIPILSPLEQVYSVPEVDRPGGTSMPVTFGPPTLRMPAALPDDAVERFERFRQDFGSLSGEGSNNWAVDGRHTETGRSLIAGDPHQPLRTPAVFWAHHMHSEAGLDMIGWSFVGAPGVHLGHNADVVWTATLNYPDMMDLWDVRASDTSVLVGDAEVPVYRHTETIEVRDAAPVEITVDRVPGYGVMLPDDLPPVPIARPGRRILFGWTGFAATDDFGSFYRIGTARNVDEFEDAIDGVEIGAFNWVAADADAITYISSMWLPERSRVTRDQLPATVLDGDDPSTYWTGDFVPRGLLPRSRATERGWIATANNDPFGFTEDGDPTNDAYYFGVYYDPGTRAARIHDELTRLAERGAIGVADMEALQTDTHSQLADHLIPLLEDAVARVATDESLAAYRDRPELDTLSALITTWDRRMERDQAAPVAFTALLYLFTRIAVADEYSLVFEPILGAETVYMLKIPLLAAEGAWPGSLDLFQRGVPDTVLAALSEVATWLTVTFGGVDPALYTWGDLHCTRFGRAADVDAWDEPCVPTDGGEGTVNVSGANLISGTMLRDAHRSGGGAVYRLVSSFGADGVPEATVNFPRGNSEDSTSPWFSNNLDDWVDDVYRPLPFRRADVEAAAVETMTLVP